MGLKNKLFFWTSLVIALTVVLLAFLVLPEVEKVVYEKTTNMMLFETQNVAGKMDKWFSGHASVIEAVAWQITRENLDKDPSRLSALLNSAASHYNDKFNYLYIGFADKTFITTRSAEPLINYDPTTRPWYAGANNRGSIVVTEPYLDVRTGKFTLSITYPVRTATPGVIATDLSLDTLQHLAQTAVFHPLAKVMLISREGTLLYSTDESFGHTGDKINPDSNEKYQQLLSKAIVEKNWSAKIEKGYNTFRIQSAQVSASGWTIAVILPESVVQAEAQRILSHIAGVFIICLMLVFIMIYMVINQITKPLRELSATAGELGEGNLSLVFPPSNTKEVFELAQSLNNMRVKLMHSMDEKDILLGETRAQNSEINALYGQMKALNENLMQAYKENEEAYIQTIKALADSIEAKDYYTRGHSDRVLKYAESTAIVLGWDEEQLRVIRFASILHDIGKIGVPREILNKTGSLTPEEYELVKTHPEIGFKILNNIDFLSLISETVLQHHERVDGLGYPKGLKGDEITPYAKVLAVADAFDAMTSGRPYKKPIPVGEAYAELVRLSGTQFDSEIVAVFCAAVGNDYR